MKDVKNILEVLEAIEVLAIPAKQALKDGLDASDLPKLLEIVKQHQKLIDAVEGIGEVVDEAKDISEEEAVQIAVKVIGLFKKIKEA
jgi:hypothetical protein